MKTQNRVIKVLKLDHWMTRKDAGINNGYSEIATIYNRDGYYYNRVTKFCWFECRGKAWDCTAYKNMFIYDIKILSVVPLRERELKVIEELRALKMCPDNLWVRYSANDHRLVLLNMKRNFAKMRLTVGKTKRTKV